MFFAALSRVSVTPVNEFSYWLRKEPKPESKPSRTDRFINSILTIVVRSSLPITHHKGLSGSK